MNRQRGMALLLVLWALALLMVLLGALVVEVRQQVALGLWQREHTRASLAAEAGMNLAVRALSDPAATRRWIADGRTQTLRFDDASLQISVRSERGKLDMNAAPVTDVTRLLTVLGASPAQARTVAAALDQRRSVDKPPLRALEELRDLAGISGPLYQALLEQVTVWSGMESPDAAFTTVELQRALHLPDMQPVGADPGPIVSIRSQAYLPDGITAVVDSIVLLLPKDSGARPFRVVRYNE
ncbi:type II secretion system minor pseudopilin GspK [Pseudomonas sp. DSP3-2-2]|uniref:type II secretion system minor pseudopilin GspK n=1 Tax=unclassified Pseudomonas TaxID=196821 RepID=UPI003CF0D37A